MAMLIDRRYNPFRDFEDIDRSFFGDNSLAEFKTDIRDIGDAYDGVRPARFPQRRYRPESAR